MTTPWLALLPAAIWAVLGLDVEEVVDVSSDAVATLPAAVVALAVAAVAGRRGNATPRTTWWFVVGGVAAGAGVLVKETVLFPAVGLVVAALLVGRGPPRGPARTRTVAAVVIAATGVLAVAAAFGALQSPFVASAGLARAPEPVHWDEPGFARRMLLGPLPTLFTASGAFGLLHVAALPLVARVVVRAARGAVIPAAAVAAFAAFWVTPVSLHHWGVLPDSLPRFLLPILPLWLLALTDTLASPPADRWERHAAWIGAAASLVFLRSGPAAWIAVPPGVAACVASSLPDRIASATLRRSALAIAAVTLPAAAALSLATPLARVAPDPIWDAWAVLPRDVALHAQRPIARRLRFAARTSPGADATRLRPFDDLPPDGISPDGGLLDGGSLDGGSLDGGLRDGGSLDGVAVGALVLVPRGSRADAACRAGGAFAPVALDLGATAVWRRTR